MEIAWCGANTDFRNTSVTLGKEGLLYSVSSFI